MIGLSTRSGRANSGYLPPVSVGARLTAGGPAAMVLSGADDPAISKNDRAHADLYVHDGRLVGLINSPSALSTVIYEWCSRQMNNHLNPRWWK